MDIEKAVSTQLANIETRTGKSIAALTALVLGSGLNKHGELVAMLKRDLGMGHGDANTLVRLALQSVNSTPQSGDALDAIYAGPKSGLRPIHDRLIARLQAFGVFEVASKKGYVSLRRKKQFATIGPATRTEVEIGLNAKDARVGKVFAKLPPGGMCQFKTRISSVDEVSDALIAAMGVAYEEAG